MVNERTPEHEGILERNWRVRAKQVILATGAIERSLVFPDNDRPGVMLASAAQAYVNRYAVRPGTRAMVFTNNDSAYAVVSDLQAVGVEVSMVVDSRSEAPASAQALLGKVPLISGSAVIGTRGASLSAARLSPARTDRPAKSSNATLSCTREVGTLRYICSPSHAEAFAMTTRSRHSSPTWPRSHAHQWAVPPAS